MRQIGGPAIDRPVFSGILEEGLKTCLLATDAAKARKAHSGSTTSPTLSVAMLKESDSAVVNRRIATMHGQSIVSDSDLAAIYRVRPNALNQAIRRNAARLPGDSLFRSTPVE